LFSHTASSFPKIPRGWPGAACPCAEDIAGAPQRPKRARKILQSQFAERRFGRRRLRRGLRRLQGEWQSKRRAKLSSVLHLPLRNFFTGASKQSPRHLDFQRKSFVFN
jgi:hypothetical protein